MARRRHAPVPDIRQHLLDAALRAFAEHGYEGATLKVIGREAGVAPGLVYHYFGGKEDLLRALFEKSGALVHEAFLTAAVVPEPRARLAALLRVSARLVRENQDFWRISYRVRFQPAILGELGPAIAAQSTLFHAAWMQLLTDLGHPDPAIAAWTIFGTLDGVFQHYILAPDQYPLDAVIESLIRDYGGPPAEEVP
jgi:AcrR family transcriptional regulator